MKKKYLLASDKEKFIDFAERIKQGNLLAFDFETTGLDFISDRAVGLALASDINEAYYIPFEHGDLDCLDKDFVFEVLRPIFQKDTIILIAHNFKFDIQFLWQEGIDVGWKLDNKLAACTQVLSWVLNENRSFHNLKYLARTVLQMDMTSFSDLTLGGKFYEVPIDEAAQYGVNDVLAPLHLFRLWEPQLAKEKLDNLFWKLEMPYLKVLAKMEHRGVDIDETLLSLYSKRIEVDLYELQRKLLVLAGRELNINSGDQLGKLLFSPPPEGFGAPIQGMTKGGTKPRKDGTFASPKPKTDSGVIKTLASMPDKPWTTFCKELLRYKELAKIKSTYIDGIFNLIRADGKLHCSFNQTGTVTGRISSSDPNLQNQPAGPTWVDKYYVGKTYGAEDLWLTDPPALEITIPGSIDECKKIFHCHNVLDRDQHGNLLQDENGRYIEVQRKIRDIYYNPNGVLLVSDYSQMEMRLMAHFSGDEVLKEAFSKGVDVHSWVASHAFKVDMEEVTKDQRQKAKAVGFGTIYGKTVYGFANDWYGKEKDFIQKRVDGFGNKKEFVNKKYLDMAQSFLDDFFSAFPGVKRYMDYIAMVCMKYGYIRTLSGRKRRLPDIYSEESWLAARAKRQAVNSKIQGSAGDYIKLAQIKIERALEKSPHLGIAQIIQVHDELVLVSPHESIEAGIKILKENMENIIPLGVDILTDPCCVERWGLAK